MSTGHVAVHGAVCKCQFGFTPDTLAVQSQQKIYSNDNGSQKLVGNTMDLGIPFQAKTFGQCKLQPTNSGYLPCIPSITAWNDPYANVQLANGGQILTENSKAICAIAGAPCVEFTWHGQTAAMGGGAPEVEEAVQVHLNPLVDMNAMDIVYDELPGSNGEMPIVAKEIKVRVTPIDKPFVPLGIPKHNGKIENDALKFKIKIKKNPAEKMKIEILDKGKVYYQEEVTDPKMLSIGNHEWEWDGFDINDNLDTSVLKKANLSIKVTVWLTGKKVEDIANIEELIAKKTAWIDINTQRNSKQIHVTLRVNLKEGSVKGLKTPNKVPENVFNKWGKPKITNQIRSFAQLKKLTIEGLEYHLGRNKSHPEGKYVTIHGEQYEVFIKAEDATKESMDDIKLVFNTNGDLSGSSNPGSATGLVSLFGNFVPERISYNVGYLKYSNGWGYVEPIVADRDYSYVSAHEIGHEIIKEFGGDTYSYGHKGSSTLMSQKTKSSAPNYPVTGEIDVMKYFQNYMSFQDQTRIVIAEEDLLGLLWCTKMQYKVEEHELK